MVTPEAPVQEPHGLGVVGWSRYVWRQLTSMRTALFLLMLLAIGAIPGSLFPQSGVDPAGVRDYISEHGRVGKALEWLGFFDVYSSVWFSAIYILLFVSLVGCIIPRVGVYYNRVRSQPPATPKNLHKLMGHGEITVDGNRDEALAQAVKVLQDSRYRVRYWVPGDAEVPDHVAGSVAAESGYAREAGNLVFHISLVGLLIAFASSSLLGYSGQMIVPVGTSVTHSRLAYDSYLPGDWAQGDNLPPFNLSLHDMAVTFEENTEIQQFGEPRSFEANVTVTDTGGTPTDHTVRVNDPVAVDGVSVLLAGEGYAPKITVRDGENNVAFSGVVPMLPTDAMYTSRGVVKVPDAKPEELGLQAVFLPTAVQGKDGLVSVFPGLKLPELVFSVQTGDLGLNRGTPQSVFRLDQRLLRPLTVTGDDGKELPYQARLRPGETIQLPNNLGSVTFESVDRYAAFSVRHDPGATPALIFAIACLLGLMVSLYVRRRRIWFRVGATTDGRTTVEYAGLVEGTDIHLPDRLTTLAGRMNTYG